ncbi:MAG: SCO family protein [Vulcanimicrobiaceae bacterium]
MAAALILGLGGWGIAEFRAHQNLAYDFRLTDQNGQPFRLSDERGHAVAVFFGYTRCPDVCPLTLSHLASARRSLGPAGRDTRVVFVTVDPQHDTPSVLKEYLARFDSSFVGVTGTEGELAPVYRAYHVWYQPLPKTQAGREALEAHTAAVWVIDRGGHASTFADSSDTATDLANDLREAS